MVNKRKTTFRLTRAHFHVLLATVAFCQYHSSTLDPAAFADAASLLLPDGYVLEYPSMESMTGVTLLSTCIKNVRDAMRVTGIDCASLPCVMHFMDGRVLVALTARLQQLHQTASITYGDASGAGTITLFSLPTDCVRRVRLGSALKGGRVGRR